ncbi:prenyltransferase/squalene oxidase repeat-containing protein [Kribbella sp. CA-247076]|uniref:prenyltransferase/squalene oxidase repeat-containing protein n=1 Tax=Kribbella sp. CA-247076 TaxID=3239941 RepID=UPI003D8EA4B1
MSRNACRRVCDSTPVVVYGRSPGRRPPFLIGHRDRWGPVTVLGDASRTAQPKSGSMRTSARRWTTAVFAATLTLAPTIAAHASPVSSADDARTERRTTAAASPEAGAAAAWMAGQLVDGAIPGFANPDWGLTIDTQWALIATEADPAVIRSVVKAVSEHVPDYAGPGWYPDPDARIAGATAKILLAAVTAGQDYRDFGGRNMRQETLDLLAGPDAGVEEGRIRDFGTGNDDTNIFSQSLAVMGLARSGGVPEAAVNFLVRQQCADGYFRMFYNDKLTCDEGQGAPDGDGTAMAVQALMTAQNYGIGGVDDEILKGLTWLTSVQKPDGSFGGGVSTEGSNTNSTGLVAQALVGGGRTAAADKAKDWVASLQLTAENVGAAADHVGAIAYNGESLADAVANGINLGIDQWRRATPQAVFALAPVPFADLAWTDPDPPTDPTPSPTVTVTATATATATVTTTARPTSTPTVTKTLPGKPPTTVPGPTVVHTSTLRPPPLPRATTTSTRTVVVMPTLPALPRPTTTVTTTMSPTPQQTTSAPTTTAGPSGRDADDTAQYLLSRLTGGNHVEVDKDGKRYVDYDATVDLGLALRQAGKLPGSVGAIASLMAQPDAVAAYAHGVPYDEPNARYAGPLAKLTLLLALSSKDAVGNDLAGELAARVQADGRITDQSKSGDQSDLTSQAYGVLALVAANRADDAKRAVDALLRQQCGDGSFPAKFGPAEQRCQTGDIAATAIAVQALNAVRPGAEPAAPTATLQKAVKALTDRQDADGVWKAGWQQDGQPSIPATSAAMVALRSVGLETADAATRLKSAIAADGGLPVRPGGTSDPDASAAALPALTGTSLLTIDTDVLTRGTTAPFAEGATETTTTQAATTSQDLGPWWLWAGLAVVLVVGGAALGWLVTTRRSPARRSAPTRTGSR